MAQRHSPSHPKETVVRVFSKEGRFFGTGCLEASGLIVTCAHVVRDALGLPKSRLIVRSARSGSIFLSLEGVCGKASEVPDRLPFFADVAPGGWGPCYGGHPADPCNDIAILRLIGTPPFRCGCLFPISSQSDHDLPVYVHGFRGGGTAEGEAVDGKIAANSQGPNGLWVFDSKDSALRRKSRLQRRAPVSLAHRMACKQCGRHTYRRAREGLLEERSAKGPQARGLHYSGEAHPCADRSRIQGGG